MELSGFEPPAESLVFRIFQARERRHHPSRRAPATPGGAADREQVSSRCGRVRSPKGAIIVKMTEDRISVALADDDVLLREGLASLLERSGFDVVGQCAAAPVLLALVRDRRPELVIVDIRMPPGHSTEGLDAARQIRAEFPDIAILVLSAHVEVEHAMGLLASGQRSGYLLKSRVITVDDFVDTLKRLVRGGSVVDPALVAELVTARHADDQLNVLSPREREVLALMADGLSNSAIARKLWVTEGTVEKHIGSILTKLHLPETDDTHRRVLAVLAFLNALADLAEELPDAVHR